MAVFLSLPVIGLAAMLQSAVVSRITLLSGCADLLLLLVVAWAVQERVRAIWSWAVVAGLVTGYLSALPWFVPLAAYLLTVALGRVLTRRLWQAPLLVMFVLTPLGTLLFHSLTWLVLQLSGHPLPWRESFNLVILPGMVLNLLLALPVYIFVRDLAGWLYPMEVEA